MKALNLFYEEPESDRWLPLDRYPRRIARRLIRGEPRPGGQQLVFLNLCAGLDRLGVPYRINDYGYIRKHPQEVACIIGKPQVLDKIQWKNPILFGASTYSHSSDDPKLLERLPVKKILVPGKWMMEMCEPDWGDKVKVWPVGIDTETWKTSPTQLKDIDIILYDKVRWEHDYYEEKLINPVKNFLNKHQLKTEVIRYGDYQQEDFLNLLKRSKAMIFLCEHETQGLAYQQTLSCGVPILAWDRGGYWQDPSYYPHKVKFESVSSVPYWDERCGVKFKNINEFPAKLEEFMEKLNSQQFAPRDYILENLTLEKCANSYLKHFESINH